MADSTNRSAVTVRIGGEDHTLRTNADPEYTVRCAKWVDDRIGEIRKQLGLIESHKAAILAALSITDELFQARSELEGFEVDAVDRVSDLARKLEMALEADVPEAAAEAEVLEPKASEAEETAPPEGQETAPPEGQETAPPEAKETAPPEAKESEPPEEKGPPGLKLEL